jgi:hypothetical protein
MLRDLPHQTNLLSQDRLIYCPLSVSEKMTKNGTSVI